MKKSILLLTLVLLLAKAHAQAPPPVIVEYKQGKFIFESPYDSTITLTFQGFNGFTVSNYFLNRDTTRDTDYNDRKGYFQYAGAFNSWYDGKKWGIVDFYGKLIGSCDFDLLFEFEPYNQASPNRTIGFMGCKSGKWGFVNTSRKILIPFEYDLPFADEAGGDCFFTPMRNTCDMSRELTCGEMMFENGVFRFPIIGSALVLRKKGKYGLVDTSGKVLLPFVYDMFIYYKNGIHQLKKGKTVSYCTSGGKLLDEYTEVRPSSFGYHNVKKKGKWGYIDNNGKEVVPCQFDDWVDLNYDPYSKECSGTVSIKGTDHGLVIKENGEFTIED